MTKILHRIPQPAQTVSGKTTGPAVALGRSRVGRGHPLYLHASELRQAVLDMGWPTPEHLEDAKNKIAAAEARVKELEQAVADQAEAVEASARALAARFGDHKPAHAAAKHPRKAEA